MPPATTSPDTDTDTDAETEVLDERLAEGAGSLRMFLFEDLGLPIDHGGTLPPIEPPRRGRGRGHGREEENPYVRLAIGVFAFALILFGLALLRDLQEH